MKLRSVVLSLAFICLAVPSFAAAKNTFTLLDKKGKHIGSASFSIDKSKNGFKVHSDYEFTGETGNGQNDMPGLPGVANSRGGSASSAEFHYSFEYSIDPTGSFQSGYNQNYASKTMTSFQPNKARTAMSIPVTQGSTQMGTRDITLAKPNFIMAANYDPSGIQVLINASLASPWPNNVYFVIIPATPDQDPNSSNYADNVLLQPAADTTGTLDGKSVALKHYVLKFHNGNADVYTDADGNLMEAIMNPLQTTYVRSKFVLTPTK